MKQTIYQVDAFTDEPFHGNPAGVCLLERSVDASFMQQVAAEMNLSETAFLLERSDGYGLRWFTPTVEVDLCGHATLASAHILWEVGAESPEETLRFHTRSGVLQAKRRAEGIELDLPAHPVEAVPPEPALAAALGAEPVRYGRSRANWLVEYASEETVRGLHPDFRKLAAASTGCVGVIVTSRSRAPEFDFVSRFFAPAAGVDEDPVTGLAHCSLAPYWTAILRKEILRARQVSRRGGTLGVRVAGERVHIVGQAVTVLHCELVT